MNRYRVTSPKAQFDMVVKPGENPEKTAQKTLKALGYADLKFTLTPLL